MQCCDTMHCHPHRHPGQSCCSATPRLHDGFNRPPSIQGVSFPLVALGLVPVSSGCQIEKFPAVITSGHSHDPPSLLSLALSPLRI